MHDRRGFLSRCAGAFGALACAGALDGLVLPRSLHAEPRYGRLDHPEPREGYTADKVATPEQLGGDPELIEIFDGVRAIPHIADGIRCTCGCADLPDMYSLLSCYEGPQAMAKWCPVCKGEGRLVTRLAKQGRTLDQIREAIDARG